MGMAATGLLACLHVFSRSIKIPKPRMPEARQQNASDCSRRKELKEFVRATTDMSNEKSA